MCCKNQNYFLRKIIDVHFIFGWIGGEIRDQKRESARCDAFTLFFPLSISYTKQNLNKDEKVILLEESVTLKDVSLVCLD